MPDTSGAEIIRRAEPKLYAWIFRKLLGPLWTRILLAVMLIVVAVYVLFEFVFPWASQYSTWNEPTLGTALISVSETL